MTTLMTWSAKQYKRGVEGIPSPCLICYCFISYSYFLNINFSISLFFSIINSVADASCFRSSTKKIVLLNIYANQFSSVFRLRTPLPPISFVGWFAIFVQPFCFSSPLHFRKYITALETRGIEFIFKKKPHSVSDEMSQYFSPPKIQYSRLFFSSFNPFTNAGQKEHVCLKLESFTKRV